VTALVGFDIVVAAVLAFLAVLCAVASLALHRNSALAWLAAALANGTVLTLLIALADGGLLQFLAAAVMAPLGYLLASQAIHAMLPGRPWRMPMAIAVIGLSGLAVALHFMAAPFFLQALAFEMASMLAMASATLVMAGRRNSRLIDVALLVVVAALWAFTAVRVILLPLHPGFDASFASLLASPAEATFLMGSSLLTPLVIILLLARIIADTIANYQRQSERDGLTGLLNRRAFDALAGNALPSGGAVIFCDIDHFKQVNDRFGHQTGDDVICVFASIISRTGYPAGRIGGEEFALLLPERSVQDALDLAEMMRTRFQASAHPGMPDERITASFGIAEFAAGATPASSFSSADAALYLAKNAGRNRVVRAAEGDTPLPSRHAA
jgi:diguanylate cyclase (GGDEF)-like protein